MNKTIVVILIVTALTGSALISQERPPRMQLLGTQHHVPDSTHSVDFWHDNETGQEVVCIFGALDSPSCYLTGRVWK